MRAANIMTTTVVTVKPDVSVSEVARLLLKHRISAVPVVDVMQNLIGIVSEGDLIRRAESGTSQKYSSWLDAIVSSEDKALEFIKSHGQTAGDVMTPDVVTVEEDTPVHEIASLLEKRHVKRVPVVKDGRLVGIVSRANLLHSLAANAEGDAGSVSSDDQKIREELMLVLSKEVGLDTGIINVIVRDGVVQLWGIVDTSNDQKAAQIAAERIAGVKAVENHLGKAPGWLWAD